MFALSMLIRFVGWGLLWQKPKWKWYTVYGLCFAVYLLLKNLILVVAEDFLFQLLIDLGLLLIEMVLLAIMVSYRQSHYRLEEKKKKYEQKLFEKHMKEHGVDINANIQDRQKE